MAGPIAVITGPDNALIDEFVQFDCSQSSAPEGAIYRWRIDWQDGKPTTGKGHPGLVGHRWAAAGTYTVKLVVTDNRKARSAPDTLTVTVAGAPVPEPDPDTTPDAFSFAPQTGVQRSAVCTSAPTEITGLTSAADISVVDGEYNKDGGAFTSAAGTITNAQDVQVRLTASSAYDQTTFATVTIGTVSAPFTVTTEAAPPPLDTSPTSFGFQGQSGVARSTVITSNLITITGINTTVPVSISGASGEYSKNGGAFTTSAGTCISGDNFRVRCTSSGSYATTVSTVLTVGTGSGSFSVTTLAEVVSDSTPDPFNWPTLTGQIGNTVVTSSLVTVTGINTSVAITISGGEYSKNGGAYTSGAGTVVNNDTVRVRVTTSSTAGASVTATVTIGGVVGSFTAVTAVITVSGTTYYVSTTGNNSNNGTSTGTPFLTFAKGLSVMVPGDQLLARGGTYNERLNNNIPPGVSWSKSIRIANYNGETVVLQPSSGGDVHVLFFNATTPRYVELDGINADATSVGRPLSINGVTVSHIRIKNCELTFGGGSGYASTMLDGNDCEFTNVEIHGGGAGGGGLIGSTYGIYVGGSRNIIDGCDIYDVNGGGIHIYNGNSPNSSNIVRNCRIHDITRSGDTRLYGILANGSAHQLYNNVIYSMNLASSSFTGAQVGIVFGAGAGFKVWHNTIVSNEANGIQVDPGTPSAEVRNNIVYNNSGTAFIDGGTNTVQSNNLFNTNPLFTNLAGSVFTLTSLSPARNAGMFIPTVTSDITGLTRPQGAAVDIGAYEFDE